jgi:hypothetical protein
MGLGAVERRNQAHEVARCPAVGRTKVDPGQAAAKADERVRDASSEAVGDHQPSAHAGGAFLLTTHEQREEHVLTERTLSSQIRRDLPEGAYSVPGA